MSQTWSRMSRPANEFLECMMETPLKPRLRLIIWRQVNFQFWKTKLLLCAAVLILNLSIIFGVLHFRLACPEITSDAKMVALMDFPCERALRHISPYNAGNCSGIFRFIHVLLRKEETGKLNFSCMPELQLRHCLFLSWRCMVQQMKSAPSWVWKTFLFGVRGQA